jgi:predicted kinase
MKAFVTVGIPASGKSTWAREICRPGNSHCEDEVFEINRDAIREGIFFDRVHGQGGFTWAKWKWKWESEVTEIANQMIEEHADLRQSIVISDTNLHQGRRDALIEKLKALGYEVHVEVFHVGFEEALKRDAARANGVGVKAIAEMYEKYCAQFVKQATKSAMLPDAVIVDVDGTLAHMHSRGPFEWDKVGEDDLKPIVAEMVRHMAENRIVIIMSGRDGVAKADTEAWLKRHRIHFDHFYIRAAGDTRNDAIVKSELYFNNVDGKYNVVAVFDDRPRVCQMWRSIGLDVIQIGNPYNFF